MKRHADSLAPVTTKPGPAAVALGSVVMVAASSLAIVVCGVLVLLATRGTHWGGAELRVVLSVAACPWALAALVLAGSAWRLVTRSLPPDTPRMRGDVLPEPMGDAGPTQIWLTHELPGGGRTHELLTVDGVSLAQVTAFAQAATNGASLAVNQWTGAGSLFTRPQYDALMSELRRVDWVAPGAGNQPRRLTVAGRAMLRKVAQGGYDGA